MKALVLFLLVAVSVVESLKPLHRAPRDVRHEGTYFVHVREDAPEEDHDELVRELEKRHADENDPQFEAIVMNRLTEAMNGFIGRLSDKAVELVRNSPIVEFIEEDQVVVGAGRVVNFSRDPPNEYWGLDRIDQADLPLDKLFHRPCGNLTGKGVTVYVMDTGIQYEHEEFETDRAKYVGCDPYSSTQNMSSGVVSRNGEDCSGHGSHVAAIAGGNKVSASPGVELFSVRVLGCDDLGTIAALLEGFNCIFKHHRRRGKPPSVINFSIGVGKTELTMARVAKRAQSKGIHLVIVGGNQANGPENACNLSMSSSKSTITVAATDMQDSAWTGNNLGQCIDLFAPGVAISSASYIPFPWRTTYYDSQTGTSTAVPRVVSALAVILEKCPSLTPNKLKKILLNHFTVPGRVNFTSMLEQEYFLVNRSQVEMLVRNTPNKLLHVWDFCGNRTWTNCDT